MENFLRILNKIKNERNEVLLVSETDFISSEIELIFQNIKGSNSNKEVEKYFIVLGEIQFVLATLLFKDNLHLSESLKKFVKDFDRIDDPATQDNISKKIKNEHYSILG